MSVYDELNDCIESAWSSDSCEYEVYSEMFDLIADAEYKYDNLKAENAKLRKLVHDMWSDGMCDCDEFSRSIGVCVKCEYGYLERMRALEIEVE